MIIDTGGYYESSNIGWGNIRTQFHGYITGYKEAADDLVNIAINARDIKTLDTFVFPICFLYRQYLELAIKDIYIKYSEETRANKVEVIQIVGHDLYKSWNKVKPIVKRYSSEDEYKDASVVESYISEFQSFDKSSLRFRYPVSKALDKSIAKEMKINLSNLKDRIHELYCFFDSCDTMIGELKYFEDDLAEEYIDIMNEMVDE